MKKTTVITPIFLSLVACATTKTVSSLDPSIQRELDSYHQKLTQIKNDGNVEIAPNHYDKAENTYNRAKDIAYQGKSLSEVQNILLKGKSHLKEIKENVSLANVHLAEVLSARNEAIDEGAKNTPKFKEASEELAELGEELEERDLNEVLENRSDVLKLFQEAEITAIDSRELKKARQSLQRAKKMEGASYFYDQVEVAEKDISSASKLIRQFKDSPYKYAKAVRKAERSSNELLATSQTATWLKKQDIRSLTTNLNSDLNSILVPFSHPEPENLNYSEKMEIIREEIDTVPLLRAELTSAQMDSFLQKRKMRRLSSKNKRLNNELSNNRNLKDKISMIENMFDRDEAKVLIEGDDLIIRLVGLNFEFNKAELPEGHEPILKKVVKTVEAFDQANVIIEGHTDAIGDALYNERLSKDRALSVNQYLVANSKMTNNDTKIIGAGFSEPLSENKTATGRKLNRRIDIVIDSVIN